MSECILCAGGSEGLLWLGERLRVIDANEPAYPGFCRVVWNAHVREMSDLAPGERTELMGVVWAVESVLRDLMRPDKINIASLGNVVPHLHWHVIPRFADDRHFPDAVWAPARREGRAHALDRSVFRQRLSAELGRGVVA